MRTANSRTGCQRRAEHDERDERDEHEHHEQREEHGDEEHQELQHHEQREEHSGTNKRDVAPARMTMMEQASKSMNCRSTSNIDAREGARGAGE